MIRSSTVETTTTTTTTTQHGDGYSDKGDNGGDDQSNNEVIEHVGTFVGHKAYVICGVEKDCDTLITGGVDKMLIEWNTKSHQWVNSIKAESPVWSVMITKRQKTNRIVNGIQNGSVELRRWSDLELVDSFKFHTFGVSCIRELTDGSMISVSYDKMTRWNIEGGTVLQDFTEQWKGTLQVIELKPDVIVGASEHGMLTMWKASTGECFHTMTLSIPDEKRKVSNSIYGLVKLSEDAFVSGSVDQLIREWNFKGECVQTIKAEYEISAMTRLGASIISVHSKRLDVWPLRYF